MQTALPTRTPALRKPKPAPSTPSLTHFDHLLSRIPALLPTSNENPTSETSPDPIPGQTPTLTPSHRKARARIQRRFAERHTRQQLLQRARYLEPTDRALILAFLDLGLSVPQIAALRTQPPKHIRNRLDALRAALSDSAFLLAVRYAPSLPQPYSLIAYDFFIRGHSFRTLASRYQKSLHAIRESLLIARSLMLITLAKKQHLPPDSP